MPKRWVWLQLVVGWLPVWALYSLLLLTAHPGTPVNSAIHAGLRAISCAALLGLMVHRVTQRVPWPVPMRFTFVGVHLFSAAAFSLSWMMLTLAVESVLSFAHGGPARFSFRGPIVGFLVIGVWLYAMVASVTYATQAAQRVVRAESLATTSQLATLRSQLNPHFLFNALHTVVQLIPVEPARAMQAAEQLATLLRTSLEETRDLVPLREEWAFVQRYLELERIRFGDRLAAHLSKTSLADDVLVPSFALQTLVENSVRHGAAPQVETTDIHIDASVTDGTLTLVVRDTGAGFASEQMGQGTGLARLRDRLRVLFGDTGALRVEHAAGNGVTATITLPATTEQSE